MSGIMEKRITEGSASWLALATFKNIVLTLITGGIWIIVPILQVRSSHYKLTSERIFITQGIIRKRKREIDLIRIRSVHYHQSFMQMVLGTGSVMIENGEGIHELHDILYPDELKEQIRSAAQNARRESGVTYQERL